MRKSRDVEIKPGARVSPDVKWRWAQEQKYVRLAKVAGNVAVTFEGPAGTQSGRCAWLPREIFKQVLADLIRGAK